MGEESSFVIDFTISDITTILRIEADKEWKFNYSKALNNWVLAMTVGGEAEYALLDRIYRLNPGALMFFQQGLERTARCVSEEPWVFHVIKFHLTPANGQTMDVLSGIPNIQYGYQSLVGQEFINAESAWLEKKPGYPLYCKACVYNIMERIIGDSLAPPQNIRYAEPLREIARMIAGNLSKNFSVSELAARLNVSESYFRLLFKQYFSRSVVDYQNFVRMTHARDLLLNGKYPINEIARMVGFEDVYYFSRLYKKTLGHCPSSLTRRGAPKPGGAKR